MKIHAILLTSLFMLTFLSTSSVAQNNPYPQEFVKRYIDGCTADRGPAVQAVCECTIRKIQSKYKYEEFKKINIKIEEAGKIPPDIVEDITTCQANPSS